eukprot:scaffold5641_cov42-Phaeocystis_antarctica.AAC.5
MDSMVSSIIHLANKDYPALVDDFINLKILPTDCNRAKVGPRTLTLPLTLNPDPNPGSPPLTLPLTPTPNLNPYP